jgi:protein ImuB
MTQDRVPRLVTIWCPEWSMAMAQTPPRNFESVVQAVIDLAPRCEIIAPGWLCLPSVGPSRYFGGEQALAQRLQDLVADLIDWPVGVGIADGRFVSTVAAHDAVRSGPVVVPAGESGQHVKDRSLRWLEKVGEIPAEMIRLCEQLGLATCGDLAAISHNDILGRFGPVGSRAHHLAAGCDPRPVIVADPPGSWEYEQTLAEPAPHLDTVVFLAKHLADQMWAELSGRGRVCTRVEITSETEHGERSQRSWYLGTGFRAAQITERVRWQLEGWAGTGEMTAGVNLIRLVATEVCADSGVQDRFWGGRSQADDDALRMINRLVGIGGPDAVRVARWQGGRLPEERYQWVSAVSAEPDSGPIKSMTPPWPGALPPPSPAVVLAAAQPILVHDVAGDVVTVNGRGEVSAPPAVVVEQGRSVQVLCWAGPWPLEQRWWDPVSARRVAHFQMLLSDERALLAAVEHQRWWITAVYG